MAHTTSVSHARVQSRVRTASLARLLQTENWDDLTAAANASSNHVKSLDRWRNIVREANPGLREDRVDRLAEMLRSQYYRDLVNRRHHPQDVAESVCLRCGKAGHQSAACAEDDGERAA